MSEKTVVPMDPMVAAHYQGLSTAELRQLPITQVAWLAKHQPEMIQHALAQEQQQRMMMEESRQFYEKVGHPEFAGKYEPFEVPKGYKLKELTEEKEGLRAVLVKVEAPSLAEQMKEYKTTPLLAQFGLPTPIRTPTDLLSQVMGKKPEVHPLAGVAGIMVAPAESLVYSVGRLMGFETPRIPTTVPSSLVSSAILSVQKWQLVASPELEEILKTPEYAVGTIFGDILLGLAIGKGAEKVWTWTPEMIKVPLIKAKEFVYSATGLKEAISNISYQFRQHAPESLLQFIYGKEMGSAIAIEREWGWSKAVAKGTAGMLEETYGMPFYRAETLHTLMPTLEWQRIRLAEYLAPRVALETQLGWELGLSPAAGISVGKGLAAKELSLQEMMQEAERIPIYKTEKTFALGLEGGELKEKIFEKMVPTGETTPWSYRGSFEFEQATKMLEPSRLFIPKSPKMAEWIESTFYGRGTPMTPMETTLSKAIMGEIGAMKGGLAASMLMPEILKEFPVQPPTLETVPKAAVKTLPYTEVSFQIFKGTEVVRAGVKTSEILGVGGILASHLLPKQAMQPLSKTILGTTQTQKQTTIQRQVQKQLQAQTQVQAPKLRQTLREIFPERQVSLKQFPRILSLPRQISVSSAILGKKKAAWYYKRHPVATGKEVAAHIFSGLPKQQRRRR